MNASVATTSGVVLPDTYDVVALKADNGNYLQRVFFSAENQPIEAIEPNIGPSQKFTVYALDRNRYLLKADNGGFLQRIDRGADQPIMAIASDVVGPGQVFSLEPQGNGQVALKADNGNYLQRVFFSAENQPIEAIEPNIGPSQLFDLTIVDAPPEAKDELRFDLFLAGLRGNPTGLRDFYADPKGVLNQAGIPVVDDPSPGGTASRLRSGQRPATDTSRYEATAVAHWWGVDFIMNEKLSSDIATGLVTVQTLGGVLVPVIVSLEVVTAAIGSVIAVGLAAVFALKSAEVKVVDDGEGVHWPITWLQWAALIAAAPGGPFEVGLAAAVFIHPLPN